MSLCDLFDMEWGYAEKEEVEIDAPFLFEKMERELKEYLLEQELEGDSTDGLLTSQEIWQIDYKKILTKLLEKTAKKKHLSDH